MQTSFTVLVAGMVVISLSAIVFSKRALSWTFEWLIFSKSAPIVALGAGGIWFLTNVLRMGPEDLGEHRVALFVAFGTVILLSFFRLRDLLAVRGVAVLLLVCADLALTNVYCEPIPLKNFFVLFVYVAIVFATVIGAIPYLLGNFLKFLLESKVARISLATLLGACGILMVIGARAFP